jgi:hypothetical protein
MIEMFIAGLMTGLLAETLILVYLKARARRKRKSMV